MTLDGSCQLVTQAITNQTDPPRISVIPDLLSIPSISHAPWSAVVATCPPAPVGNHKSQLQIPYEQPPCKANGAWAAAGTDRNPFIRIQGTKCRID